jgi:hypothetical protein
MEQGEIQGSITGTGKTQEEVGVASRTKKPGIEGRRGKDKATHG